MIKPFIKWAGGKDREISHFSELFPPRINNYFEPFLGGAAVMLYLFSTKKIGKNAYVNDLSSELIQVYEYIKNSDREFIDYLYYLDKNWMLLDNIVENHASELFEIYSDYKKSEAKTEDIVKERIEKFIENYKHEFNGMLTDDNFNIMIDDFLTQIKDSVAKKMARLYKVEKKSNESNYDEQNIDDNPDNKQQLNDDVRSSEKEKQNKSFSQTDVNKNILTGFKSGFYVHFRNLYNSRYKLNDFFTIQKASAIFYFIREYCYSSMFRYNHAGEFNVPYGGMAYNSKNFHKKIDSLQNNQLINYLKKTQINNLDYRCFIEKIKFEEDDFIFFDPPYDSEFSDYAENQFTKEDQIALRDILMGLFDKVKFMVVIKETPFIKQLYENKGFYISTFKKKYMVNFKNRNVREVTHFIITNYEVI